MSDLSPMRVGRITGSRVGGILGMSPYADRASVLRDMVRQYHGADAEFAGNELTEYGTQHEDDAVTAYEVDRGVLVHSQQAFIAHPVHDWLGVSVDGLVGDDGGLEVKAPMMGTYETPDGKPHYRAQCYLSLACTGRAWWDFGVWRADGTEYGRITITRFHADDAAAWLAEHLDTLREFHTGYLETVLSDELSAPHLAPLVTPRDDDPVFVAALAEWERLTAVHKAAKEAETAAKKALDEHVTALGAMAGAASTAAGLIVETKRVDGRVSYADFVRDHAPGADLEAYRGAASYRTTVRRVKP
jgi:predicted RNase H-like HicB family nuclease